MCSFGFENLAARVTNNPHSLLSSKFFSNFFFTSFVVSLFNRRYCSLFSSVAFSMILLTLLISLWLPMRRGCSFKPFVEG